jgi:hypothetical protein
MVDRCPLDVSGALLAACEAHPEDSVGRVISQALWAKAKSSHIYFASDDELVSALLAYAKEEK